MVISGNILS
jgi:hypothetical protein